MNRKITALVPILATVAIAPARAQSDVGQVPCHPCLAVGACAPVDPLESGADHVCQNHAKHEHRRLEVAGSDFSRASFAKADLRGTQFYGCVFEGASLYAADLSHGRMIACQADRLVLLDAQAADVDFSMSSLRNGYFVRADFSHSILVADFCFSDFHGADLTGAVLSAGLEMADFCNADLSSVVGLPDTVGMARYSPCTDFSGTGFDPAAAGWVLAPGAEVGERYCTPAVPNSTGNSAILTVSGCTDVRLNSFELRASCLPMNQYGLFLASQAAGFVANPGESSGNLCLGGRICSFPSQVQHTGLNGELMIAVDLSVLPPPLRGGVQSGETWYYQAWFRDVEYPKINPRRTTNFTDAVSVAFD